jgi:flagellar motor protein MotB
MSERPYRRLHTASPVLQSPPVGKTVWDDMAEGDADTRVRRRGEMAGPPRRRLAVLPWLLVALIAAGMAGVISRDMDERGQLKRELATARDESAELRHQVFAAQDRVQKAEKARLEASTKVEALSVKTSENDKLIADLRAQVDSKDGDVEADANRVRVNLVDQILFKSGDAEISPRGKKVLDKVGTVLKKLEDKQILIGGHTDDRPIHTAVFRSNWELSAARAINVVHYLAETVGVDAAKLTGAGYGEYHPRSKRDKAKNRRIEILLTPTVEVAKK